MIIKNALLKSGVTDIYIKNGVITEKFSFDDIVLDAKGKKVIPGLIDTHIHGFDGIDVSDLKLNEMSIALAKEGTTCFLPTTMTYSDETLKKITSLSLKTDAAVIPGFHLEGPYISKNKKGAQNEKYVRKPDINEFLQYKNVVKITVAPEVEGCLEFIEKANCLVSIGHTECDYDTAIKAIELGANCLTHTFNAMPPLLHRAPGPIGAAAEKNIYAEVICDGNHISKAAILALYKMFGADRLILISDAIRPANCPDGEYDSGELKVLINDGIATLCDGTLAGGSQPLLYCVKKAVEFGIDFYDAVKMASETPAKSLGLNKGKIEIGYDADLVILNDDFSVYITIIGGNINYSIFN